MPLLRIEHVTHFFGGLRAVSDFNLELQAGQLLGVIGPNGAGKTTIFNLITGVYRPGQGSIVFDGTEIAGVRPDRITSLGIARTFQNIRLFRDLSVLDNIRVAQYDRAGYSVLEALLHAGRYREREPALLEEAMDLLAVFAMDGHADEPARNLSYGLQRRLEIVRALATRPKLLLLDEPAAGMNPQEVTQLMGFIRWIRERFGLTIILIEHQMRLVMGICEWLKVLDFGATIAEGTPAAVQADPKVLEAYLGEEVA